MSKLLSKIIIASGALTTTAIGTFYLSSASSANDMIISNNLSVSHNHQELASLVSVWDQETEQDYSGETNMTVYRSPSCGCCGAWIEHAKKHGFNIEDIKTNDMEAIKQKYNIPPELQSCHTVIIDGYVMEGHIPADDIKRFLKNQPEMTGLAVPGMPIGTPGMEARDIKQPFQVLVFNDQGEIEVFREYLSY